MRLARATLATACLAASVVAGCGGSGSSPADRVPFGPAGRPAYGFNDNSVRAGLLEPGREAALAARGGARVVRLTFDWRFAERTPGTYDFAVYDRIYRALRAHGIRPLWTVIFAPPWAWDRGTRCTGDCRYPPARRAEGRYGALVARIARRYPRSAGIEVWNEPNLTTFWQPRPDAARYSRLLAVAHRAVRRVAPRMPVVNGGLSNNRTTDDRGNVSLHDFLTTMYRHGAARSTDAVSFHPYPVSRSDSLLLPSVGDVLDVLRKAGRPRTPLWVTELGATTTGPDPDLRFDPAQQARALADSYCRLAHVPTVRMVLVHTLLAPPGRAGDPEAGYGLLLPTGRARPAFGRLARVARRGC